MAKAQNPNPPPNRLLTMEKKKLPKKAPLIPFEEEYIQDIIGPRVLQLLEIMQVPSPGGLYEAFCSEYKVAVSPARFRKWLKILGVNLRRGWYIEGQSVPVPVPTAPTPSTIKAFARANARKAPPPVVEGGVAWDRPPVPEEVVDDFKIPEPNILPGGVPAPVYRS